MRNKILWLSILGLALARPPNGADSNIGEQQKARSSRSIWPFTSSATTTEAPITYPPPLPDDNKWFVQGDTPLPEGIDLNKYPVWKVHKYHGIDLHPVELHPENVYPPEQTVLETGYTSGSSSSSDFNRNSFQNGYQDFQASRGQSDLHVPAVHGTYSTGYPPAGYPPPVPTYPAAEQETYQSGEFHSSSFIPGNNQYNVQTQQKHEVYAPPQPLKQTTVPVVPQQPQIPHVTYGVPDGYYSNVQFQGQSQMGNRQAIGADNEQQILEQSAAEDTDNPDLSFLDNLGGLGTFLPDAPQGLQSQLNNPQAFGVNNNQQISRKQSQSVAGDSENPDLSFLDNLGGLGAFLPEAATENGSPREQQATDNENSNQGFFGSLFSRFRGTTETPAVVSPTNEASDNSGGFFSSVFGIGSKTPKPDVESTESSGGSFSSLFNQAETERPAVVLPTTYYLPKTRGSYIALKLPASSVPGFTPNLGPFDDVANIAIYEAPKVPFTQREIPYIPSPTLDSRYPNYNLGYSEVRNSGYPNPSENTDFQPPVTHGSPFSTGGTGSVTQFKKNHGDLQRPDFEEANSFPRQSETIGLPQAEYFHSSDNGESTVEANPSSQPSSPSTSTWHYHGQQRYQHTVNNGVHHVRISTVGSPQFEEQSALEDRTNTDKNLNQVPNSQDYSHNNYQAANSNIQNNYDRSQQEPKPTVSAKEPATAPQISASYIPASVYGSPTAKSGDQIKYNLNGQRNGHQTGEVSSYLDVGDRLAKNFDNVPALSHDLVPPKESGASLQSPIPVYPTSISAIQNPIDSPPEVLNTYETLPVKGAIDFRETPADERKTEADEEIDNRFIQNLSSLTSYGTPTSSYYTNSLASASSNVRNIAVAPSTIKDKVNDGIEVNANAFRSTVVASPAEQTPTKESGRVIRKVLKRRTSIDSNRGNHQSRRSTTPERQAPTEEVASDTTSSIIRSEKDLIPEVRGGQQFDGTKVISGYSKVQHQDPRRVVDDVDDEAADNSGKATKPEDVSTEPQLAM
ncbi:uncharacterized protein LOC125500997 [Athalia rosae]|uniref:uncharacterized protein LOC125500997 n=1 Tax=Athalia rosae TaxID=37344 RepID=UPI0020345CC2|nr:uncharacterized protein LOC125500997 [Athalia rosae]